MPEIGERNHAEFDKTNGYEFLYRLNVIKPHLVDLASAWICGEVEFNRAQYPWQVSSF